MSAGEHPGGQRLRVAMVASWYPTTQEPANGIFIRDQAQVLAGRHDVGVIAPRVLTLRALARGRLPAGTVPDASEPARVASPLSARFRSVPALEAALYPWAIRRGLRAFWPDGGPDLLHAQVALPAGIHAVRVGRRLGLPVVLTEHSGPFSALLGTAQSRADVVEALTGAAHVIAVSEGLADEIRAVADVPVDVVPNVIHPAFFAAVLPGPRAPGPLRLLAIGFHHRVKRYDLLLEALAAAVVGGTDAELRIVGDGPLLPETSAAVDRLGLGSRVRLEPGTDRAGLLRWLAWSDLLVSTSDHESFGLVLAEALAAGRPVIATASGGPEGFVEPSLGRLVPTGDASAIAAAIAASPGWLASFDPAAARARMAERLGPDAFRARITAVYESLASARRRRPGA